MGTPTLDEIDEAILEHLAEGRDAADLTAEFENDEVNDRLAALAESGLVSPDDDYELTDSGRRVLAAPGDTTADDRIDVPERVEETIQGFDLPPDRAAAIRGAFAFLAYWGEATAYEIRDAIYSERPTGFESVEEWWEFVRERLAGLPEIDPPAADDGAWGYAGRAGVNDPTEDGRHEAGESEDATYAGVKHALESLDPRAEEREAAHAVFAFLADRDEATEEAITAAVYDEYPAGYGSPAEWWDRVSTVLEELPGVARDGETWRYRTGIEGGRGGDSHVSATAGSIDEGEPGAGDDPP